MLNPVQISRGFHSRYILGPPHPNRQGDQRSLHVSPFQRGKEGKRPVAIP